MKLKYGCNPNQSPAEISIEGRALPLRVLNGAPGYINMLDALNGWQLVRELKEALGLPAAASFKHTSPAGAAVGLPLTDELRTAYFAGDEELSPLACAYIRARGADRLSSFGDFAALSDRCDASAARALRHEVSDGVIAPGYDADALAILKEKRGGSYIVLEMDEGYAPPEMEARQMFGLTLTQRRNDVRLNPRTLGDIVTANKALPEEAARDLTLALITLKYTQSNSVCFAQGGQATGIGAGQQSRVHCVRLAGQKADTWWLRQHPDVLKLPFAKDMPRPARDNAVDEAVRGDVALSPEQKRVWLDMPRPVALASDGFFPFSDNIDAAAACGARYIAQPGGSVRDKEVIAACDKHGMVMVHTGIRLFYH